MNSKSRGYDIGIKFAEGIHLRENILRGVVARDNPLHHQRLTKKEVGRGHSADALSEEHCHEASRVIDMTAQLHVRRRQPKPL